jgi:hypothetical protein
MWERAAALINVWVMGPDVHTGREIYVFSFRDTNGYELHVESYSQDSVELGRLFKGIISKYLDLKDPTGPRFNIPGTLYLYDHQRLDKFIIDISKDFPYMEDVLCYAVHNA